MSGPGLAPRVARARELLVGFPPEAVDAAEAFLRSPSSMQLDRLIVAVLSHYLAAPPPGTPALADRPKSTRLVEELALDSLAFVELSYLLQDMLGVRLHDSELRTLHTLGDLQAAVGRHLGLS